jgi:hypothetical protein
MEFSQGPSAELAILNGRRHEVNEKMSTFAE